MGNGLEGILKAIQNGTVNSLETLQKYLGVEGRPLSFINGLMGDTLEAKGSPLAIEMKLLGEARGKKLCILVHGLCDSETTWDYPAQPNKNYGSLLEEDLCYGPLFLRYNSGLHISTNGQRFSRHLDEILQKNIQDIQEILLIAHSMGGLVVRSACHYGKKPRHLGWTGLKRFFSSGLPIMERTWKKSEISRGLF
jgi:pimeloyl-ACP methyl ester carboxylesterase